MPTIILILLFCSYFTRINAFDCNNSDGLYANPNDYQSYYVCEKNCPYLHFCPMENPYFSSTTHNCSSTPNDWIPWYYLSGKEVQPDGSVLYVQQDGHRVLWTFDDSTQSSTFTGRYVNATHVRGIELRRVLTTNCINLFNVELIASADRTFCNTYSLDIQSSLCDITYPYDVSYCRTLAY